VKTWDRRHRKLFVIQRVLYRQLLKMIKKRAFFGESVNHIEKNLGIYKIKLLKPFTNIDFYLVDLVPKKGDIYGAIATSIFVLLFVSYGNR